MATIKVPTSFNIDVEFEIPEFYRRLLSLIIDIVIEIIYLRIALAIIRQINLSFQPEGNNIYAIQLLFLLPFFLYHVVLEITMNGQSVGKKIMGMRVVHENGGKASISQFLIRWLLRVSDVWMLALIILIAESVYYRDASSTIISIAVLAFLVTDIVLVVSSKKGQRIGDFLAHTILIRTNTKSSIEETVFQEVADSYVPSYPQIMQLSDRDINSIKSILETAKKKHDYNMAFMAAEKIKAHLNIQSSNSPFEFLELLLKDYNYLSTK